MILDSAINDERDNGPDIEGVSVSFTRQRATGVMFARSDRILQ
jgi:hypothetical protein